MPDKRAAVEKLPDGRLRVVQIIVAALMAGVLSFAGFVLFGQAGNQAPIANVQAPTISYLAFGVFAAALLMWAIVPKLLAGKEVAKIAAGTWSSATASSASPEAFATDTAKLLMVFQAKSIIAGGLVERSAFPGCAAYMIERHMSTLGVVACSVLLMLLTFQTRNRVQQWLEKQQLHIDQTREFGESSKS